MSSNLVIKRMYVERHRSTDGSAWIVPELDNSWPPYTRLSWKLGVIHADTGADLVLTRHKTNWSISALGVSFGGTEPGPGEVGDLWRDLSTFATGYEAGRRAA